MSVELNDMMKKRFAAPLQVEIATVLSFDEQELTIKAELADETVITDVRLKAAIDLLNDGIVQEPEVGSTVLIGRIGNDESTRFVLAYSKVVKIKFYGGAKSPMVIWEDKLKTELDKVKSLLTHLINVINGAPVTEPGSGAASALQAALKGAITGDTLPSFEGLTDDKVFH